MGCIGGVVQHPRVEFEIPAGNLQRWWRYILKRLCTEKVSVVKSVIGDGGE